MNLSGHYRVIGKPRMLLYPQHDIAATHSLESDFEIASSHGSTSAEGKMVTVRRK